MFLNQEACVASRFIYVEADRHDADRFCERLHARIVEKGGRLGRHPGKLDMDLREQVDMLMMLDDEFRVWGKTDGKGLVIRSDEPVDFHPINKTANVVRVDSLDDAIRYVNVATQTVGFYPFERMRRTTATGSRAAAPSASCGWARRARAPSATRTMPCIRCTASCTGWRTRMGSDRQ